MAISNLERVSRGLDALKRGLAPYMARQLKAKHKARWWAAAVEPALRGHIGDAAKGVVNDEDRLAALDV